MIHDKISQPKVQGTTEYRKAHRLKLIICFTFIITLHNHTQLHLTVKIPVPMAFDHCQLWKPTGNGQLQNQPHRLISAVNAPNTRR
jgi:hypothetical protein